MDIQTTVAIKDYTKKYVIGEFDVEVTVGVEENSLEEAVDGSKEFNIDISDVRLLALGSNPDLYVNIEDSQPALRLDIIATLECDEAFQAKAREALEEEL